MVQLRVWSAIWSQCRLMVKPLFPNTPVPAERPLAVTKTRMQISGEGGKALYRNALDCAMQAPPTRRQPPQ